MTQLFTPLLAASLLLSVSLAYAQPALQAPSNLPDKALNKSALVQGNAVIQKNGTPINGVKLSQHDLEIISPSIALSKNGTIHVVFGEKHHTTYAMAIYHRSSTDGGKTWTEAKNLSEDMPNIHVGRCVVLVDGNDRVYVIWRTGLGPNFPASADIGRSSQSNIVYRVLEGGKWTRIKPVGHPGSTETQDDGTLSYLAGVDASGKVQVIWNAVPNKWHPELTHISGAYHQPLPGVGAGLVFQSTLDGSNPTEAREIYMTPVAGTDPTSGYGTYCDGLEALTGFFDAEGKPHFLAQLTRTRDSTLRNKSFYQLVENGKGGATLDLPDLSFHAWSDVPTLLVDAAGKQHALVLYPFGEHPSIRDYVLGSDDEPTVIRQSVGVKGSVDSFQALQGPGGRMVAIMEMNDTGDRASGDTFISISRGNSWSPPVNVTNNLGRRTFVSKQTSRASNIVIEKSYYPGPGAAAFDHEGNLLLVMINNEYGLFAHTALGVQLAGGSSSTPTLQFLHF